MGTVTFNVIPFTNVTQDCYSSIRTFIITGSDRTLQSTYIIVNNASVIYSQSQKLLLVKVVSGFRESEIRFDPSTERGL